MRALWRAMGVTVGVMARAPIPGRCKTRLGSALGHDRAASLYRAMLLDTLDALAAALGTAARLAVLAAPEDGGVALLRALVPAPWDVVPQRGEGLGPRLANALCDLAGGSGVVALVDSDSPTVDFGAIARALNRIEGPNRALMGPCADGGYYLIALTSADPGIFEGIAWSTSRVQEQTRARCAMLGLALEELPPGYDVDDERDLARLRAELRETPHRAPRTATLLGEW